MDCSLPGSSVHRIFQATVLEWGAIAFSKNYSRDICKTIFQKILFPLLNSRKLNKNQIIMIKQILVTGLTFKCYWKKVWFLVYWNIPFGTVSGIKWIEDKLRIQFAAAAAKSLQSCPTLCDPIDGGPPGFPVPGILQARTLEWVAISFSNVWKWKVKGKSLSRVRLLATPWTAADQAPPSIGFSRQEYWSGLLLPSPSSHAKYTKLFPFP